MSETMTKELTRDDAQTALNIALEAKQGAQTALNNFITEKREVEKDIANAKAILMERDAQVLLARAALARFGPLPRTTSGASSNHNEVREAVLKMLGEAGSEGMATDDIFNRLQDNGVSMGGEKPRQNLNAYLSRWASAGVLVKAARGKYAAPGATALPSFLAPHVEETHDTKVSDREAFDALVSGEYSAKTLEDFCTEREWPVPNFKSKAQLVERIRKMIDAAEALDGEAE